MRAWAVRVLAALSGAGVLILAVPGVASAHPLGNFTVNRYSGVIVSIDKVTVDHVVDIAEIPTAQRKPAIDTSGDGTMSKRELAAWVRTECTAATDELQLSVAGSSSPLSVAAARARLVQARPGFRSCGASAR